VGSLSSLDPGLFCRGARKQIFITWVSLESASSAKRGERRVHPYHGPQHAILNEGANKLKLFLKKCHPPWMGDENNFGF